jgi:prepilin-type N-terminal cleavage/methylation domain-containing protein
MIMLSIQKIRYDQAGFTLVEIAIVMVIIGLLIGGVLKGQAMIENGKAERVVKQADELRAAIMTFYEKFGVYPGDEALPNVPPGGCDAAGNANGQMGNNAAERGDLYVDLSRANLISGTFTGTNFVQHVYGGDVWVYWTTPIAGVTPTGHYIRYFNFPANVALELDIKYDDGTWNSGMMVGSADYSTVTTVNFYIRF